jgi:hypothetical protein
MNHHLFWAYHDNIICVSCLWKNDESCHVVLLAWCCIWLDFLLSIKRNLNWINAAHCPGEVLHRAGAAPTPRWAPPHGWCRHRASSRRSASARASSLSFTGPRTLLPGGRAELRRRPGELSSAASLAVGRAGASRSGGWADGDCGRR